MKDKTTKKIYLSGPISGRDIRAVKRHFAIAAFCLIDKGVDEGEAIRVVSPDKLSAMDLSWDSYMKIAKAIIEDPSIDGVHMLRGWEKSKGCRLEIEWAIERGLPVTYEAGALTL